MTKAELRQIYREKRRRLTALELDRKSRSVAHSLFSSLNIGSTDTIHCFISIHRLHEIDTSMIFRRLWSDFPAVRTLAPQIETATGELLSISVTAETSLLPGGFGINEPAGLTTVPPTDIDIAIIPLLCFDREGHRVGYGKGFYDRFLSTCRSDCTKVGLSHFAPIDKISDAGPHDIPLDICFTADGAYAFNPV